MNEIRGYIKENAERFIEDLREVCRVPSIAAQNLGIEETAKLMRDKMHEAGISARVIEVPGGNPVVYGEVMGQGDRTLLFYNHYDAQPPDPLDAWDSDPFAAEIRDGKIFGRGVADNKGNAMARIKAVEAFLRSRNRLPVNVKFVIEGEEEVGSPSIGRFVREHADLLKADACIWEAGYRDYDEHPEVVLGMKGIVYIELRAKGAKRDMHSANATIVSSPAWELVAALSTMSDSDGNVLIEGFYDDVLPPTDEDIECLRRMPYNEERVKKELGLKGFLQGLTGLKLLERNFFGPTCNISGIWSGYTAQGMKTVLPSTASAKMDFRLVPNQDPEDILAKIQKHLTRHGFGDIEVELLGSERPSKTSLQAEITKIVAKTVPEAYGMEPVVFPLSLGTGPMYYFSDVLGLPVVSTGIGWAHSNMHAPNENVRISDYLAGIEHIALVMDEFGTGANRR